MVLNNKQAYVAYRCPHCGQAVLGFVGNFALKADMLKLKCPCGGSEMTMTYTNDQKIRVQVPCVACPTPHQFVVSQSLFFGRELFLLNCPYSNLDICFIGTEAKVTAAVDENARQLNELYSQMEEMMPREQEGAETEKPFFSPEEFLPDAQVYDVVRFLVRELQEDGAIDCPCHSGSYEFDFTEDGVRVFCPDCGAARVCPANSVETAQEFLNCDELILELPGAEEDF